MSTVNALTLTCTHVGPDVDGVRPLCQIKPRGHVGVHYGVVEHGEHNATRLTWGDAEGFYPDSTDQPSAVLDEVRAELSRQDVKWGEQNHPDGTGGPESQDEAGHWQLANERAVSGGHLTWRLILLEEVYEALAESDPPKLRAELIQVAAVATQWVGAIDRRTPGATA